jgi:hypothetical protein
MKIGPRVCLHSFTRTCFEVAEMSLRSERRESLWGDVITRFGCDRLINWAEQFWARVQSWFDAADCARMPARAAVRSLCFDCLESRQLLSSDVGLTGFNAATGAWTVTRYDGTEYTVESAPSWTSTSNLQNVQTVDLWGRGYADLIGYDSSTGTWWGTWNVGTGTTTGLIAGWAAGATYQNVVTGDFNQDGHADFAGWDPVSGQLVAATSTATGFASQIVAVWSPTDKRTDITAGDFNHDGYTDIAGFDATTGAWHMLFGSAQGLTKDQVVAQWNPTQNWQDLTTGAFYHDGNTDILGYNATTGDWHTLSFNGSSFQDRVIGNWSPAENWQIAGVGDFWGIGQGMILGFDPATGEWRGTWAVGSGTSTGFISGWLSTDSYTDLHLQQGIGTAGVEAVGLDINTGRWIASGRIGSLQLTASVGKWDPTVNWQNVTWGDLNNDGIADIVGYNPATGGWTGLMSGATGYTTQSLGTWSTLNHYVDVKLADPQGNATLEIISRDQGTWNWYSLGQTSSGFQTQALTQTTPTGTDWQYTQTADLEGDNSGDLIGWNPTTGDWWATLWFGAESSSQKIANWDPTVQWKYVTTADYYGNGKTDIIGWNATTGDWHVISYNGTTFQDRIVGNWSPHSTWQFAGIGDIWGIGQNAIVGFNTTTDVWWATWAVGSGTTTAALQYWTPGRYSYIHLQDTNGDGRMDWVGFDSSSGNWYAGYSAGGGKRSSTILGTWDSTANWTDVVWGDLNGDGLPDILGFNAATQTWTALISNSGGPWQQQSIAAPAGQVNWSTVLIGDVNGDRQAELLGYDPVTGNWQAVSFAGGNLTLTTIGEWDPIINWTQVQLADVNGDGIADLVGFNTQSNTWSVLSDVTGQFATTQVAWTPGTQYTDLSAGAAAGLSNATLRREILQEIPTLSVALASSPLDAANLLLNWTANATNFAISPQFLLQSATSAADAYFNYFQTNGAGQSCGGFSWFYSEILKLFNIDAIDIGVGVSASDLSHSFVLIPEMQNGQWTYYVFDPTFNVTYSTPTSPYADFFQLMDLAFSGQSNTIVVNQGTFPTRTFLANSPQSTNGLILSAVQNSTYVYSDINYGLNSFLTTYAPALAQYGYTADLSGYLQFVGGNVLNLVSTSSDLSAQNAFVSQLQAYGIPFAGK